MPVNNETPYPKASFKGELLRRVAQRIPEFDTAACEVVSHIQSIARSLSARMNAELAAYGLSEGKFYVLAYLHSEELQDHGCPSATDIADNLGVTRGTITGLLDGLERDGFLEREHDKTDRRALHIRMTEKARTVLDSFFRGGTAMMSEAIPLELCDKRQLTEWLSQIERALALPDT